MRLRVQRAARAEVRVGDAAVGRIGRGLVVFVGVAPHDGDRAVAWAVRKLLTMRVFADPEGRTNLDLPAVGGELLVVSQFTLFGDLAGGRRPGFSRAAPAAVAEARYAELVAALRRAGAAVATGAFGRAMEVELVNDGPFTLWLDSADDDPSSVGDGS